MSHSSSVKVKAQSNHKSCSSVFSIQEIAILSEIISIEGDNRPHIKVDVMGFEFEGLLDSGASCTIIGKDGIDLMKKLNLIGRPTKIATKTADGTLHVAVCSVDVSYRIKNKVRVLPTLIVPSLTKTLILGIDFWHAFNIKPQIVDLECAAVEKTDLVPKNDYQISLTNDELTRLNDVISKFPASNENYIGLTKVIEHSIDTGNAKPVVKRAYQVSPYVQKNIDAELDRMIKLGVIEPSNSDWANPIVAVKKSNGRTRLCLDARGLNEVTVKDRYPLPHIGRILQQIRATKYLTSIDLKDAFWQVGLEKKSRSKTAFNVPGRGHFQFKRLPFGLCNSAQTLCKALEKAIGNDLEPSVFVYIDDIIVVSDTFDEHLRLLEEVARRLDKAGFSISHEKSRFCAKQLHYLGYVLDEFGLGMDPEKITPILNIPPPKNLRELRRIMGMSSWYRRFIRNFSDITSPMTELLKTKKMKNFVWTKEADEAFRKLKTALVSAPVLTSPDFNKQFTIQTDASDTGLGAVLTQGDGPDERVISYMSMKLTSPQRKYSTTEKECLAVIEGIRKFRSYIEGARFRIITDHASLLWLKNLKDPTSRLARWALKLQEYDFELIHRKGKLNVIADALSRSVEIIDIVVDDSNIDEDYRVLREKIQECPSKYPGFLLKNNLIYKYCRDRSAHGIHENNWKLYVPQDFRDKVFKEMHDHPLGAHFGVNKTLKKIQEFYYWPKLDRDVRLYVKTCDHCQVGKHPTQKVCVPMGVQKNCEAPWESVSIDFLGQFPRSKSGNKYLFVLVDNFSKWCILKPMRRADTKSVVNFLEDEVFLVYGVPTKIICDNGPQFISKEFVKLMKEYGVVINYNAVYHPQHNPAERLNRVILSSIRAYNRGDQTYWDAEIPKIACAMRNSAHDSTGFTPYMVNFGKSMNTHGSRIPITDQVPLTKDAKISRIKDIHKIVNKNLNKAYDKFSRAYNLRTRPLNFEVGDIVLRKLHLQSSAPDKFNAKLAPQYEKCKIKKKIGYVTYMIENMEGKVLGKYHANDLRKYYGR